MTSGDRCPVGPLQLHCWVDDACRFCGIAKIQNETATVTRSQERIEMYEYIYTCNSCWAQDILRWNKFCPACGRPINWTRAK